MLWSQEINQFSALPILLTPFPCHPVGIVTFNNTFPSKLEQNSIDKVIFYSLGIIGREYCSLNNTIHATDLAIKKVENIVGIGRKKHINYLMHFCNTLFDNFSNK